MNHLSHPVMSCHIHSLLQLLILWLFVSSLSPHNLLLLFCYALSVLLWHSQSIWRSVVLLSEEIQFLCKGLLFLTMVNISCVRCHLFLLLLLLLLLSPGEFFTSVLADGLLLEFEWQQVSSSLQDSSQYSGRSQYCCSLDGLHSSSYFQLLHSLL